MKVLYIRKLLFILSSVIIYSCSSNKFTTGKYHNNISPFGLTSTEIIFKSDGSCYYLTSRHMQEEIGLNGKYFIISDKLYIYLIEPTESEIKNHSAENSFLVWSIKDEYNLYQLKGERGITYHFKYKIIDDKLYVYRSDNGKLVKKAKHYNEEKGKHYTPYYLRKING